MTAISVQNVGLVYRVREKLTLARRDRRVPSDGQITEFGRGKLVTALDDVTFALNQGDRLGLIGPNGAGKTTLLKLLYGVYRPSCGTIMVRGRVDALFNISLGFRMEATGRRNIELRGLINGWGLRQIAATVDEIVEFSELGDFIDMPYKTYSQGMAARLAFATATTLEPEIVLMDEWIGAGDPDFQIKAKTRMERIADKAGIIVLATHNYSLLRRVCNKVLKLENGRVVDFGSTEEVLSKT